MRSPRIVGPEELLAYGQNLAGGKQGFPGRDDCGDMKVNSQVAPPSDTATTGI